MSEKNILAELFVENICAHVKYIVETMPSRLAGSDTAARMAEYSAEQIRKAGLDTRIETLPGLVSFPGPPELRVLKPEEKTIATNTLAIACPRFLRVSLANWCTLRRASFPITRKRRHRQNHTVGTVLFSGPARKAAHRRPHGVNRANHPELEACRKYCCTIRVGQASLGEPDARNREDTNADNSLHRHLENGRALSAGTSGEGSGARMAEDQGRERLA